MPMAHDGPTLSYQMIQPHSSKSKMTKTNKTSLLLFPVSANRLPAATCMKQGAFATSVMNLI